MFRWAMVGRERSKGTVQPWPRRNVAGRFSQEYCREMAAIAGPRLVGVGLGAVRLFATAREVSSRTRHGLVADGRPVAPARRSAASAARETMGRAPVPRPSHRPEDA